MNLKRFFSQMAFAMLCLGSFSAQMPAMEPQVQREYAPFYCGNCNARGPHKLLTQCGHALCQNCYDFIDDHYQQLDITSFCPVCDKVLREGNIIVNQQNIILNLAVLDPALEPFELWRAGILTMAILGCTACWAKWASPDAASNTFLTGCSLVPLGMAIRKTLDARESIASAKNYNSKILENRTKTFIKKYWKNACIASLVPGIALMVSRIATKYVKLDHIAGPVVGCSTIAANYVLNVWGSKYESIPKLK